ncbi:hypothetical protein [Streptomyces sp. NPDC057280]|uniref:hypothetical protein n=1 Tax=Streptomyces sp. NPDC057280 TaxID=3346081 RepID=UPI00363F7FE1
MRGALDALLDLPGTATASKPTGMKSAAQNLLDAVDAYRPTDEEGPATAVGRRPRRARDPQKALHRIRQAADELRPELKRPGGYHRRRARNIAERVMGQQLGAAQDHALDAWGKIYSDASGVLHGSAEQKAAAHYRQMLRLAREVFVPLPGRAQEIVALAELQQPTRADADVLAGWADPRALRYFFLSRPAAAWLDVLDDVLLLPDIYSTTGHWPAAPYLDHLAQTVPGRAGAWLADHAAVITDAGVDATAALLRLADRPGIGLNSQVRTVLTGLAHPQREVRVTDGWLLRLAADWAQGIPLTHRDQDWIFAVEALLRAAVRAEHAADEEPAAEDGNAPEARPREDLAAQAAARLPDWQTSRVLAVLVHTADHTGIEGTRHAAPTIRTVLASLVRDDLRLTDPVLRHAVVFHRDLAEVSLEHPEGWVGLLLVRALLDLAAADAQAGVPLAERTAALVQQVGKADERLRDRLLAAHLDQQLPDGPTAGEEAAWWEQARALLPVLLARRPTPEGARLADYLRHHSPDTDAYILHTRMSAALGTPPGPDDLASYDPSGAGRPPRAWLRVWRWSPVLPEAVAAPWEPALALLRQVSPSGPADPRTADPLFQITDPPQPAVTADQAARLAAEQGPSAVAAVLAAAPDAGTSPYLMVLRTLIDHDPTSWTTDPLEILTALALPELQALYLAVAADYTRAPGAFPGHALAKAAVAALTWHPATTTPAPSTGRDDADDEEEFPAADLAQQAMLRLLTAVWRTDTNLGDQLPAALDHLYALTHPLTTPAAATDSAGPDPAGPALQCLLDYARHHARTTGRGLPERLTTHLNAIVDATGQTPRTAAVLGPHLPLLHTTASDWVHAHRTTLLTLSAHATSAAASWLRRGPLYPPLLTDLDRGQLLDCLRNDTPPETTTHIAHALLNNPAQLGAPGKLFTHLAHGDNAPATIARLLHRIALDTELATTDPATTLWRTALAAPLPEGALAGAGAFARTDIDDTIWLELTLASARHTPALDDPDHVAERAANHPHNPTAALITALLLTHPSTDPWRDAAVRDHARLLLTRASQLPSAQRPDHALRELRDALITAGDLDAHRLYQPDPVPRS